MPSRGPTSTTEQEDAWLESCGCPARHVRTTIEYRDKWADWYEEAMGYFGLGSIVVLIGDRGSGKTQIATELMRRAMKHRNGKPAPRYAHTMDFFLSIRSAYGNDSETTEHQQLQRFTAPNLLVLDEAHERGGSDWEDRMLRHVIDKRYGMMLDTVLVANMKREKLMESMGKSVASRIDEIGTFIECVGVNFRKPIKDRP